MANLTTTKKADCLKLVDAGSSRRKQNRRGRETAPRVRSLTKPLRPHDELPLQCHDSLAARSCSHSRHHASPSVTPKSSQPFSPSRYPQVQQRLNASVKPRLKLLAPSRRCRVRDIVRISSDSGAIQSLPSPVQRQWRAVATTGYSVAIHSRESHGIQSNPFLPSITRHAVEPSLIHLPVRQSLS